MFYTHVSLFGFFTMCFFQSRPWCFMTFSLYRILLQNKQEKLKWNLRRKPLTCRLMLLPHILYSIIKLKSLRTNFRMHSFLCIRHPFLSKCLLRRWKRRKLSLVIIFLCKRDWRLIVRSCLFLTCENFGLKVIANFCTLKKIIRLYVVSITFTHCLQKLRPS